MATSPRPALTPLSEVRAARVERIVVAKLDRLTQSVRDLAELIELCAKHEVALVSIGEALEPRIGSQSQLEFPLDQQPDFLTFSDSEVAASGERV